MKPKTPPPEHCTPAFVAAFNRSTPFRTIDSDAPAETIARLSVELAQARGQVARMSSFIREMHLTDGAITDCEEGTCGTNRTGAPLCPYCAGIWAVLSSAPDLIALPRGDVERMQKALGMGARLCERAQRTGWAICADIKSPVAESDAAECATILAEMEAAANLVKP